MRAIRWAFAILVVAFSSVSGCAGCTENKPATAACKGTVGSTACKACCGMHGTNVSSNWSGCVCYARFP